MARAHVILILLISTVLGAPLSNGLAMRCCPGDPRHGPTPLQSTSSESDGRCCCTRDKGVDGDEKPAEDKQDCDCPLRCCASAAGTLGIAESAELRPALSEVRGTVMLPASAPRACDGPLGLMRPPRS
jgi:hypothetical protein